MSKASTSRSRLTVMALSRISKISDRSDRGQACDSAILAVKQGSRTAQIASLLPCPRPYGHVGREFKLRPFSAGSILTLRNRIEPPASTTSMDLLLQNRDR